ncbi:DUF423 domain-containing protein [Phytohalomonas tamaricis]|uniref:DUF423 domain-containing protein n=1 Tax=Phytohalomonas tamaricis TaxID=2081032 RepID=UPI000D0BDEFF|nr:DUF423 domain-containing protein [Phytohalomonas tamaricis]
MENRIGWAMVAFSGFIVVAAGAFGAHALTARLSPELLNAFETGVRYQAWHTAALLAVLAWRSSQPIPGQRLAMQLWGIGIVLFSGSLYVLALSGVHYLGIITPIGGVALMAGWLTLLVSALKAR